jgi:pyruvate/2-oxoglutarate dehydrogenase complex dihydrolipoamide acyltransferase (E2) component
VTAEIRVPSLGVGMTEATLAQWLVSDGQAVNVGDPIYTLETDKSTQEIAATVAGTLKISVEPGALMQVGALLGHIE